MVRYVHMSICFTGCLRGSFGAACGLRPVKFGVLPQVSAALSTQSCLCPAPQPTHSIHSEVRKEPHHTLSLEYFQPPYSPLTWVWYKELWLHSKIRMRSGWFTKVTHTTSLIHSSTTTTQTPTWPLRESGKHITGQWDRSNARFICLF